MAEEKKSSAYTWITFIAVFLTLLGIYASARTIINLVAFDKYPQGGVLSFTLSPGYPYYSREQDCENMPGPGYEVMEKPVDVVMSEPMVEESSESSDSAQMVEPSQRSALYPAPPYYPDYEKQKELCLSGVREARNYAKVTDISESALLVFLGLGLMFSRKKFFS